MMVMDPNAMGISGQMANTRADILNAGANNTSALLQGQSGDTQTLLQSGCGETASIIAAAERQSFHTQAQIDRLGHGQGQAVAAGFLETRANLNNGFTANLLAAKDGQLATAHAESKLLQSLTSVNGALAVSISETKESVKGLVGNLALQNQVELSKYFAISEREINKQFALATLAASENVAKLSSQIEECCCEVKAVVNSTAGDTQNLIQATEANRVREALAAVQQENLFLRLRPVA
jgi:hypothetical protein